MLDRLDKLMEIYRFAHVTVGALPGQLKTEKTLFRLL